MTDMTLTATAEVCEDRPDRILVNCSYRSKEAVKAVPGSRWDVKRRRWTTPLSWPACLALRAEFGGGLTIGDNLRTWAASQAPTKKELIRLRTEVEAVPLPDLPGFDTLRPYQTVAARAIALAGQYLLLDETGTGKTRSALAGASLLRHEGAELFPMMIVAPKSMLLTWARDEVARFFPTASISVVGGTPARDRKALEPGSDIYIISWDKLRTYSRLAGFGSVKLTEEEKAPKEIQAIGLRSLIADEGHRATNPKAKCTRAAWAIGDGLVGDKPIRIGLTGTPLQDTPQDLYGLLRLILPNEYPTKSSYTERYLLTDWNEWGGMEVKGLHPDRQPEFFANFHAISRRMTKAALPDLPEKVYQTRWVTLPPKLRKAYEDMRVKLVAELEASTLTAENMLVQAGRLIQLANSGGEVDAEGRFHMKPPSPKVDAFLSDVKDGDYEGHSVIVFSDSRMLIDLLADEMDAAKLPYTAITGSVTGDDRQKAIDAFQAGEVPFMLLTRAGGEGVTLTAADIMVRLVRPWSYRVYRQVEDRCHRIGSERHDSVTYVDYVTDDTVEIGQVLRLNDKESRSQEVLRDEDLLRMLRGH
jgi:SNF2 family DNA or RNA helicase